MSRAEKVLLVARDAVSRPGEAEMARLRREVERMGVGAVGVLPFPVDIFQMVDGRWEYVGPKAELTADTQCAGCGGPMVFDKVSFHECFDCDVPTYRLRCASCNVVAVRGCEHVMDRMAKREAAEHVGPKEPEPSSAATGWGEVPIVGLSANEPVKKFLPIGLAKRAVSAMGFARLRLYCDASDGRKPFWASEPAPAPGDVARQHAELGLIAGDAVPRLYVIYNHPILGELETLSDCYATTTLPSPPGADDLREIAAELTKAARACDRRLYFAFDAEPDQPAAHPFVEMVNSVPREQKQALLDDVLAIGPSPAIMATAKHAQATLDAILSEHAEPPAEAPDEPKSWRDRPSLL